MKNARSTEAGAGSLISGILSDLRSIFAGEIAAARLELKEDLRKTGATAVLLGVGLAIVAVGSLLLAVMAVYFIASATRLPLWACYGLVGGGFVVIGFVILYWVRNRAVTIDLFPRDTARDVKQDAQWIKNEIRSDRK